MTWSGEERRAAPLVARVDPELQRTLGRIEATVTNVADNVKEWKVYAARNSERIGSLERSRAWVLGAAAVIGALFSWIVDSLKGA